MNSASIWESLNEVEIDGADAVLLERAGYINQMEDDDGNPLKDAFLLSYEVWHDLQLEPTTLDSLEVVVLGLIAKVRREA